MHSLVLLFLLLASPMGEDVPHPGPGEDPDAQYGYRYFGEGLACLGDLDGDGIEEFTVSDPSGSDPSTVWILSGADAHVVDRLSVRECGRDFGWQVARIPDVEHDGIDEIAVASGPRWNGSLQGRVRIYSGRTRELLRMIEGPPNVSWFARRIEGMRDIDGDGAGELLVTATDRDSVRCGFLYSGRTGELLREFWCPEELDSARVFPIGDVDRDGWPDLALTGLDTRARVPVAALLSCRDGRCLGTLRGSFRDPSSSVASRAVDDLDGGGSNDVLLRSESVLEVFSSEDARPLHSVRTPSLDSSEAGLAVIGDIDGDGSPDIVLADPEDGLFCGSATCRSGRTGAILWQEPPWLYWRNVDIGHMGRQIAVIGDFNHDAVRDFVWATDNSMNGSPGLVFISSGKSGRALKVLARGPHLEILRLGPQE